MTKYAALGNFLKNQNVSSIPMTFREIEAITGHPLPQSKQYPAWWSNNTSNNVMTKVWLEAGFRTEQVDIGGERLVFRRVAPQAPLPPSVHGMAERARDFRPAPQGSGLFGALKGTFTILPDATAPAFDAADQTTLDAGINRTADLIDAGMRGR
jgi:hypothetical protein